MEAHRVGDSRVKVILDTNMILLIARGIRVKEDIESALESEAEFLCPDSVIRELQDIVSMGKSDWRRAQWCLLNIDKICTRVSSIEASADEDIILLSDYYKDMGYDVIVATNDRELRRKLRSKGVPTAYLVESEMLIETDYE